MSKTPKPQHITKLFAADRDQTSLVNTWKMRSRSQSVRDQPEGVDAKESPGKPERVKDNNGRNGNNSVNRDDMDTLKLATVVKTMSNMGSEEEVQSDEDLYLMI